MWEKVVKYTPINFELVANPVNWIIVFLMIVLAGAGLALIMKSSDTFSTTAEE